MGQLESLLVEYKDTMTKMETEIHDLTGDLSTVGDRRPRAELVKELEVEQRKRETAEEGKTYFFNCSFYRKVDEFALD